MNQDAKKKLLRYIPNGLFVIGVKSDKKLHAFTGSWVTQISMKPPAIVIGVRKDSRAIRILRKGKVFTLNYIRKENKDTLAHFFKPVVHEGNRLGHYHFHTDATGAPILDEAIGYLECRVKKIMSNFGDHAVVIGEIVNAKIKEDLPPLILSDTPWHYGG